MNHNAPISSRRVSLIRNTVWRDANGRITVPGCLTAVTATTEVGDVWDVSTDTFRLRACIGRQPKQSKDFQACPNCDETRTVCGTIVRACESCGGEEFDMADMPYFMTTKNIIEGLTLLEKYREYANGRNTGAGHDQIYAYPTDKPVNEDDLKRLVELGWFQQGVETGGGKFGVKHYDADEEWSCFV